MTSPGTDVPGAGRQTAVPEGRGAWVYAVAGKLVPEWFSGMAGVAGNPVRVVTAGGLAAAVTTVSLADFGEAALRRHLEDLAWLETVARIHHEVIEAVFGHGPAVPMRLATVYRSDASLAAMLTHRQDDFAAALGRVAGRTEWGVKVSAGPPAAGQELSASPPAAGQELSAGPPAAGEELAAGEHGSAYPAAGTRPTGGGHRPQAGHGERGGQAPEGPGAAFLRRRRSQLAASQNAAQSALSSAERIHLALGQLAVASHVRPPQDPQLTGRAERMILNAAYLVDNAQMSRFTAGVESLAGEHPGLRVELTGPWPPYSFVFTVEDTAGPAGQADAAVTQHPRGGAIAEREAGL